MTRFKDQRLQAVYDATTRLGQTGWGRSPSGVLKEAYTKGKAGLPARWSRRLTAYAAWAAGRDAAKRKGTP